MSVDEPYVCYKCHTDIYAQNAMPSHHPIKEGKMTCSDCHDPHGQTEDNLKEPTINMVCYKCHADKQGPVRVRASAGDGELCDLPQSAWDGGQQPAPPAGDLPLLALPYGAPQRAVRPQSYAAVGRRWHESQPTGGFLYRLHPVPQQIHGSDLPSPHLPNAKMR